MGFRTSVEASFYMRTRVYDLVELARLDEALWNLGVRGGIGGGCGSSGDGGDSGGDGCTGEREGATVCKWQLWWRRWRRRRRRWRRRGGDGGLEGGIGGGVGFRHQTPSSAGPYN